MNAKRNSSGLRRKISKELAILFGFVFLGLVVLPFLIYFVGQAVFGDYGGVGYGEFYSTLNQKVRNGDYAALFLIFSPYIGWQCIRLAAYAWRAAGRSSAAA